MVPEKMEEEEEEEEGEEIYDMPPGGSLHGIMI